MRTGPRRGLLAGGIGLFAAGLAAPALGQQGAMRLVVPWAPGGQTDIVARLFAEVWARQVGQAIVVENRSGASGTIGHAFVAAAPADGRTVLLATNSTYAIAPHLLRDMPYQHDLAFAPVMLVAQAPMMLCARGGLPAPTVAELMRLARGRAAELTMGIGGSGSTSHLASELLMAQSGMRFTQVGYRGAGDTVRGLATGEIDLAFLGAATVKQMVEAGSLRALGATGRDRSRTLPEVPTMIESGLPEFEASTAFALFVPRATPAAAVQRLHATALAALDDASLRARLAAEDIHAAGGSPEMLATHVGEEAAKWGAIIRGRGITAG